MESAVVTKLIVVLAGLAAALGIFWLGTIVGFRQAEFSSRWAGHYSEVFSGMRSPFSFGSGGMMQGSDVLVTGNGAIGTVTAVSLPTLVVKNPNEAEKVVTIGAQTVIRKFRSAATSTDIHQGDFITVIGTPDDQGRIKATFIRIMPPPPSGTTFFSTSTQRSGGMMNYQYQTVQTR